MSNCNCKSSFVKRLFTRNGATANFSLEISYKCSHDVIVPMPLSTTQPIS